jgi:hypothetical protein
LNLLDPSQLAFGSETARQAAAGSSQNTADNPFISRLVAGTVSVPHVEQAAITYCHLLGWKLQWQGKITRAQAEAWDAPKLTHRHTAVVGPSNQSLGVIRFVEVPKAEKEVVPFTTLGWTAMELRTRDVDELARQLEGGPFTHLSGPLDLKFGDRPPTLRAMQMAGLAGEVLYFTQSLTLRNPNDFPGNAPVGPLFVIILASRPFEQTLGFYGQTLAMKVSTVINYPLRNANQALHLPLDRKLNLTTARAGSEGSIEIDSFPEEAVKRPVLEGSLPPGVAMCTLSTPKLEEIAQTLRSAAIPFRRMDQSPADPLYGGKAAVVARGRCDEIIEFVES